MAVSPRSSKVGLAIATSSSWGTATAVGAGNGVWVIDDLKASLSMQVDEDDSAGQDFISSLQVANHNAIKAELVTLLHYNDVFQNQLWALACGTGATSTFEPATQKTGRFATIVRDKVEFISEVPSAKCTGFELSFGDNGRGIVTWMFTGTKEVVDSAINTSTQVSALTFPTQGLRAFLKELRLRINTQGATTLSTSDEIKVTDFKITYEQPLDELFVNNQDYILEPEDNAYPNIEVAMTFARLDSTSEDYIGYHRDNTALKMEALLTYIGGSKSLKFEFPRLQVAEAPIEFKAGAENVQPEVVMKAYKAAAAPSGMSVTAPFRITTEGTNTTNYFA
jgi:hypothetical protein